MVGWLSYGVGNLKSTTSPPHAIEGSVFHVKRGCVTCWGWGGVFMGSWAVSFFWFYGDVVVSRGTWAMLVKEIFCDCSHVSWCLKVSRCFTWNTTFLQQPNCFTWNVGCFCCRGVFWVLVFLVGGGCFTWNMGNACNEIPRVYGRACRRCWILSRIFLKFIQFVLADGCVVFVWVSVELLGACHLDLCFPGSFQCFTWNVSLVAAECGSSFTWNISST